MVQTCVSRWEKTALVLEAKEQVLANLANFAYDPINYEYFKKLNIVDLFLDCLEDSNDRIVEFGIGGICNCCLDKEFKQHILNSGGVDLIVKCLSRPLENTVMSAITTLMFLVTPQSKAEITILPIVECMLRISSSSNKQLANLAQIFLQDYCTTDQIDEAKKFQQEMTAKFVD
ncbi:armadillo repeat-containing protein 7-like isoform X2 [Physella acuta]|uniref:armadillo repeat-containing protein 7-like isoform X2 n=1 Tax=Physella acuta TaxID=109671 RepID=UPI0027DBC5C6|nr:armadillo repeat-containing protein 7-like isoform X2 [Physella acuta]